VRCFVVAGFLLTGASRGPSAIAEPLVLIKRETVTSPNSPMINYEFSDILRSSCVSV